MSADDSLKDSAVKSALRSIGGDDAVSLVSNPMAYIFSAVALWVVKNVFVQPSLWFIALIEEAGVRIQDAISIAEGSVFSALAPVSSGLSDSWDYVIGGLSASFVDAGLGAPLAASVATAVILVVLVTVVVLVARILLDVIPGGGAFL